MNMTIPFSVTQHVATIQDAAERVERVARGRRRNIIGALANIAVGLANVAILLMLGLSSGILR